MADIVNPTEGGETPSTAGPDRRPDAPRTLENSSENIPENGPETAPFRRRAGTRAARTKRALLREIPLLVGAALVLTMLVQGLIARVYVIPSESMEATLRGCDGCTDDRVLADRLSYRFTSPRPGDVVIFRGPDSWARTDMGKAPTDGFTRFFRWSATLVGIESPDEQDFVKRVVATGGQTVQCCDAKNRVMVDGKPLTEPYIHWEPGRGTHQRPFPPVRVPPGYLWVMGDNRNDSADSRLQGGGGVRGAVPVANVIGKAQFIVLPPSRWGRIPDPNPQGR